MPNTPDWDSYTSRLATQQAVSWTDMPLLTTLAGGTVLDAGCGIGGRLARLLSRVPLDLAVGIDLGRPGLQYGSAHFPLLRFTQASVYHLPFAPETFDLILCIEVIEHLAEPTAALHEYYRIARPGGKLFLQTPNYPIKRVYDYWHWLRGSRSTLADDPTHVSCFGAAHWRRLVQEAGWTMKHIRARNLPAYRGVWLRTSRVGYWFGQKIIIVAEKPLTAAR